MPAGTRCATRPSTPRASWSAASAPDGRPGRVGRGAFLLFPPVGLAGAPSGLLRGAPDLRDAGDPLQRGQELRAGRPAGPLRVAHHLQLGHPGAGRPGPRDVCLARRAHQLHLGAGLAGRREGALRPVLAGRLPRRRQGHPPLPRRLLAGLPDERRPRAAKACLRPRLVDQRGPENLEVAGQRHRPARAGRGATASTRPAIFCCARCPSARTAISAMPPWSGG